MKTLLIGTNNPSKLHVFEDYLAGLDIRCVTPASLGLQSSPAENERSALGNAIEKAKAWHKVSGLPVITEDSGLVFLDLPKDHPDQPGVMVRRASGHTMDDKEMLAWYQAVIHRHGGKLRAAWEDAWCVLQNRNAIPHPCGYPGSAGASRTADDRQALREAAAWMAAGQFDVSA